MFQKLHSYAVLALTLCGSGLLPAAAQARAAESDTPRYPRSVVRRGPVRMPEQLALLPDSLRPAVADFGESGAAATRPDGHRSDSAEGNPIDREARAAARQAAEKRAAGQGRREYYRIGFHRGLRAAVDASGGGEWEVEEGRRLALGDPDARRAGQAAGGAVADELSRSAAAARVSEQFHDLSRDPRFLPFSVEPGYAPQPPLLPPPTLEQTFVDFPWNGFTALGRRHGDYLADWSHDPWSLRQCDDPAEFHSRNWVDVGEAFEHWRNSRARRSVYANLDGPGRARFREVFDGAYARRIGELFPIQLQTAFEVGLSDGWAYGSFVRQEWNFRSGYHAGYLEAWADSAAREFDHVYAVRYAFWYAESFAGWSDRPHPEIASIRLRDADDDGVFEPGERVLVDYELINYGGTGGRVPVRLDGAVLEPSAAYRVDLAARGRMEAAERIDARIDVRAPLGETSLSLSVGDGATDLPFRVAHPLRFVESSLITRRDNLAGRVSLQIDVENQSRRPVEGRVDLTRVDLSGPAQARTFPAVGPGQRSSIRFDLVDLDPLELIAGRVGLSLSVHAEGVEHHGVSYRLPDTVRDLANRDLPLLIERQAYDAGVPAAEIVAVRDLLLERLRADWRAAAIGRGNPYKKDFKKRGSRTALGDLVELYRRSAATAERPEVFEGLSGEILELSELLPGAHPMLRKYMRRLAEELP